MSKATNKLDKILSKLSKTVKESIDRVTMLKLGEFTTSLIVKRTRLGYGVTKDLGNKEKLAKLKSTYIVARERFDGLSSMTTPRKSNLTRSGQMLDSMKSKYVKAGTILITPTGSRDDGLTNAKVAEYNATRVTYSNGYTKPARVFNRVSAPEFNQLLRFYRKTFGDLVKKSFKGSLIRK